ncbi:MAG: polyprenyl synthetase family protein [Candidatus Paralactobacillus gallistercoris]|uniref:Farnesyl diphosphate synthase n=1 Tax=Candidatus Paralactobacillus gallistercoris TaxID=2838724 RepID=A0A948TJE8_9LACO|nr:polyprenyl synthetase family protein [Candidatus Paralactobacillus gallistercoris]
MYQNYHELAQDILPSFNEYLDTQIERASQQPTLTKAMQYSLDAGGKRLRPLLLFATVATFSDLSLSHLYGIAGAVELVHTYSLIHDDLPAMDDATLRRGQAANHRVFGEAEAILAGDALLTLSFEWLSDANFPTPTVMRLVNILAHAAGPSGMVAGQMNDIKATDHQLSLTALDDLNMQKTGALITAAVQMGAALADVPFGQQAALEQFANDFGLAFQIKDDLLDMTATTAELGKPANQDDLHAKNTYPRLLGVAAAQTKIKDLVNDAQQQLAQLPTDTTLLASFLDYFKDEMGK